MDVLKTVSTLTITHPRDSCARASCSAPASGWTKRTRPRGDRASARRVARAARRPAARRRRLRVCEQVKRRSPATPVVMVTSVYRTAQARRDAFAVGADAFLLEPVAPAQLVRTVEDPRARRQRARSRSAEPWLITDAAGQILEISPTAAQLLNLSARGARGRNLLAFFRENRPKLMTELLARRRALIIDRRRCCGRGTAGRCACASTCRRCRARRANACTCAGSSRRNRAESQR